MGDALVTIRMLGPFSVERASAPIDAARFGSRKAREVLKWLADRRNDVVSDDILIDALWPELPQERALRSLRVRTSELRKTFAFGDDVGNVLERIDNGYVLRTVPGVLAVDVDQFLHLAQRGSAASSARAAIPLLEQALLLYRGDYMADDMETVQWQAVRQHCRAAFMQVVTRLADCYEQTGRYDAAIDLINSVLARPDREEAHYRTLMRLQYRKGDQTGVLRTYRECRAFLDEELGVRPMPETMQLLQTVLRLEPLPPAIPQLAPASARPAASSARKAARRRPRLSRRPSPWPFLGRKEETAHVAALNAGLSLGTGGIVWIHGPSGFGKTRLLEEVAKHAGDDAGASSARVMWIRGSYLHTTIPFAAMLDGLQVGLHPVLDAEEERAVLTPPLPLLQELLGWSMDDAPAAEQPDDRSQLHDVRLRQEFLQLFGRLAGRGPLICCVDDVETLGGSSQALLMALARRTDQWPLLFLIASRNAPEAEELGQALLRSGVPMDVMPLAPLSVDDLRPLVQSGIPALWSDEWLQRLHEETHGEPLALVERLNTLKSRRYIDVVGDGVMFRATLLAFMAEVADVATASEHLGEVFWGAETAAGVDTGDYRPRRTFRLLEDMDESEYALLSKAAVLSGTLTVGRLQRLSDEPRASFHPLLERLIRKGYIVVETVGADAERRLRFNHARMRVEVYQSLDAAERMWYHERAFELLTEELAATEGKRSPMQRMRLMADAALHALHAGAWEAGADWSLRAAETARRVSAGPEVVALCRQAYRAAQRLSAEHPLRKKVQRAFADALAAVQAYQEALPLYEQLYAEAESGAAELDDGLTERFVTALLQVNRSDEAAAVAEGLGERARTAFEKGRAQLMGGHVRYRTGRLEGAVSYFERAIEHFNEAGDEKALARAHTRAQLVYWDLGRYDRALQHAETALRFARDIGGPELIVALNHLGELYQDLACTARAFAAHREAMRLAVDRKELILGTEVWRNLGLNYVHDGRTEKGLGMLQRAWRQVQDLGLGAYWQEVHMRSLLEAHLLNHDLGTAQALLQQYRQVTGPREAAFVVIFEGAIAMLDERLEEGEAVLQQVQAFWDETGRRGRAAHVYLFVGQTLLLHNESERGRHYLQLALEEMERVQGSLPEDVVRDMRRGRLYRSAQQGRLLSRV